MPVCPVCNKFFKSLGYARHCAMHKERSEKAAELANQHTTHDTGKPQEEICPFCGGSGRVDFNKFSTCGNCNGTGKLPVS